MTTGGVIVRGSPLRSGATMTEKVVNTQPVHAGRGRCHVGVTMTQVVMMTVVETVFVVHRSHGKATGIQPAVGDTTTVLMTRVTGVGNEAVVVGPESPGGKKITPRIGATMTDVIRGSRS
jgi:hypothetical protein